MDIVEKLRRQADSDEKAGTLYAHEIFREAAAEIERLRKRCSPSRVVMIGDVGHYVSEGVAEGIESLRQALRDIADPIAAWQRDLQPGYTLDGGMCVHMANDPETYKRMAREALRK